MPPPYQGSLLAPDGPGMSGGSTATTGSGLEDANVGVGVAVAVGVGVALGVGEGVGDGVGLGVGLGVADLVGLGSTVTVGRTQVRVHVADALPNEPWLLAYSAMAENVCGPHVLDVTR
jgi:hypothetical protein